MERVEFSGAENYAIERSEGGPSYREDDVYYTESGVLDTSAVNSYVSYIASLALGEYYTYDASDEDIAATGLDDPELTVTIDYPESADEGAEILSFTTAFSRGAEDKLTDWDEVLEAMEAGEESGEAGEPADEDAVAYLRVGGSAIIYEISCDDFKALMACSYNDLRHTELFPAETEDIASLTVTLDGETHELTTAPPEDAESDEAARTARTGLVLRRREDRHRRGRGRHSEPQREPLREGHELRRDGDKLHRRAGYGGKPRGERPPIPHRRRELPRERKRRERRLRPPQPGCEPYRSRERDSARLKRNKSRLVTQPALIISSAARP